jgi:hypothetical protein
LIGAMIAFLGEINLSLRAAQLDWEFAAKSSTHS